jgi:hypothetical protein
MSFRIVTRVLCVLVICVGLLRDVTSLDLVSLFSAAYAVRPPGSNDQGRRRCGPKRDDPGRQRPAVCFVKTGTRVKRRRRR